MPYLLSATRLVVETKLRLPIPANRNKAKKEEGCFPAINRATKASPSPRHCHKYCVIRLGYPFDEFAFAALSYYNAVRMRQIPALLGFAGTQVYVLASSGFFFPLPFTFD